MKRLFIIFLACLCGAAAQALAAGRAEFEQANALFEAGDFAGAADAYERILEEHGPRAAVFYNLGNSHLRMEDYGRAILAYERARLLTPRDPDLRSNLALARKTAAAEAVPAIHAGDGAFDRHKVAAIIDCQLVQKIRKLTDPVQREQYRR
jgi:tetratricopeptide (TPR) repeat protein